MKFKLTVYLSRKKHRKHRRSRKNKEVENGITEVKVSQVGATFSDVNGKEETYLEVLTTEESDEEKLVDLDSDEVDCTIIEDDIDLEELMKQKVKYISYNVSFIVCLYNLI